MRPSMYFAKRGASSANPIMSRYISVKSTYTRSAYGSTLEGMMVTPAANAPTTANNERSLQSGGRDATEVAVMESTGAMSRRDGESTAAAVRVGVGAVTVGLIDSSHGEGGEVAQGFSLGKVR